MELTPGEISSQTHTMRVAFFVACERNDDCSIIVDVLYGTINLTGRRENLSWPRLIQQISVSLPTHLIVAVIERCFTV